MIIVSEPSAEAARRVRTGRSPPARTAVTAQHSTKRNSSSGSTCSHKLAFGRARRVRVRDEEPIRAVVPNHPGRFQAVRGREGTGTDEKRRASFPWSALLLADIHRDDGHPLQDLRHLRRHRANPATRDRPRHLRHADLVARRCRLRRQHSARCSRTIVPAGSVRSSTRSLK